MRGVKRALLSSLKCVMRSRTGTSALSKTFGLECGVPNEVHSLVPLLFTIYASKLFSIIKSHLPPAHSYVDDTQLYFSSRPLESTCEAKALDAMEKCIANVRSWTINDKLMLNDDKTEFLMIGTSKQLFRVSVRVGDVDVIPVYSVKNLGSWFDSHMIW